MEKQHLVIANTIARTSTHFDIYGVKRKLVLLSLEEMNKAVVPKQKTQKVLPSKFYKNSLCQF